MYVGRYVCMYMFLRHPTIHQGPQPSLKVPDGDDVDGDDVDGDDVDGDDEKEEEDSERERDLDEEEGGGRC